MAHFSFILRETASGYGGWLAQFIFLLIHKIMLIKTVLKFRGIFSDKCSEINVIVLPPKKWKILYLKFYAEYKYLTVLSTLFHLIDLDLCC